MNNENLATDDISSVPEVLSGRCLCGAVSFAVATRDLRDPDACHCSQCRRWTGHFFACLNAPVGALVIKTGEEDALTWYRASAFARRGFCAKCGSSLFWHADKLDQFSHRIAVALGALDAPTGLKLCEHIYVADKGDYYDLNDGLPQKQSY